MIVKKKKILSKKEEHLKITPIKHKLSKDSPLFQAQQEPSLVVQAH